MSGIGTGGIRVVAAGLAARIWRGVSVRRKLLEVMPKKPARQLDREVASALAPLDAKLARALLRDARDAGSSAEKDPARDLILSAGYPRERADHAVKRYWHRTLAEQSDLQGARQRERERNLAVQAFLDEHPLWEVSARNTPRAQVSRIDHIEASSSEEAKKRSRLPGHVTAKRITKIPSTWGLTYSARDGSPRKVNIDHELMRDRGVNATVTFGPLVVTNK